MPGNYANTSAIVDGQTIDAADVKAPIDALDDQVKGMADATYIVNSASAFLNNEITLATALSQPPAIGGTTAAPSVQSNDVFITRMAGNSRLLQWRSNTSPRWAFECTATAESGSNVGSDLSLFRYNDAGSAQVPAVLTMARSTGNATFGYNLTIMGALSKGSGTFKIDHPVDPYNKLLYHGFVEAPRYDLIYRGRAKLVGGRAAVDINAASRMSPGTFEALTQNAQVWVQNETGWARVRGAIGGGELLIECEDNASSDTISWLVIAERADAFIRSIEGVDEDGRMIPEIDKVADETAPDRAGARLHEAAFALREG